MEWGIVMSVFTVAGMLMLIFAQPETKDHQTFGHRELNPPRRPAKTAQAKRDTRTGLKQAA
ncbi:MAG TPA: hypothetical protein VFA38_06240 [Nitrospirales bacterium]|nr:hypothetical protein [Nitrospirales bacterium]